MNRNFRDSRGFATIAAAVIVLVVLAVGGGAYYASDRAEKRANPDANLDVGATTTADANVDGSTSLRALVGLGQNLTCTFSKSENGATNSGVVYVAGGRMRGDFKSEGTTAGTVTSHMVNDGEYSYVWSDAMAGQGIKTKAEASASATARGKGDVDWNDRIDYECSSWDVDGAKFALPSGTTFLDLGAAVSGAAGPSTSGSAGVDVKSLLNI